MSEKPDAFRYEFTMKELSYFLFAKKKCPKCGGAMNKKKDYEIVKGTNFNKRSIVRHNQRVKHYTYSYVCKQCGARYTLEELANKGNSGNEA